MADNNRYPVLLPDLENDPHRVFWTLTHFRHWVHAVFPSIASDYDITLQQLTVLYLVRKEDATMAQIARYLHIAPTVVTSMVDGLEANGMINRAPHPTDRRKLKLVLTDLGNEASIEVESRYSRMVEQALGNMTLEEQAELTRGLELLNKLVSDLEASNKRETAGQ